LAQEQPAIDQSIDFVDMQLSGGRQASPFNAAKYEPLVLS